MALRGSHRLEDFIRRCSALTLFHSQAPSRRVSHCGRDGRQQQDPPGQDRQEQQESGGGHWSRFGWRSLIRFFVPFSLGAVASSLVIKREELTPTLSARAMSGRRRDFNFIADVVAGCADSVVYIEIKDTRHFDYFSGQPITASNGSGFIIEQNGLILTNAHVVINKPHTMVQVRLSDGRTFPATIEDVDQTSDLATLRIQVSNVGSNHNKTPLSPSFFTPGEQPVSDAPGQE